MKSKTVQPLHFTTSKAFSLPKGEPTTKIFEQDIDLKGHTLVAIIRKNHTETQTQVVCFYDNDYL